MDVNQNFEALWVILIDDTTASFGEARNKSTGANRRNAIRSLFALVDGAIFLLKDMCLARAGATDNYSLAEMALLRDEQYSINAKGEAVAQPRFSRTDDSLKFVLAMYVRGTGAKVELDCNSAGWNEFKQMLSLRHEITHPKRAKSLQISDGQFAMAERQFIWFVRQIMVHLAKASLALHEKVEKLKELIRSTQSP